jgi:uncharacterized protein YoxC
MKTEKRITVEVKESSIKDNLKEVKRSLLSIIETIDTIEKNEGNMNEGVGLIHKANRVVGDLAHTMSKASDVGERTAELAFELGRDFAKKAD